MADEAHPATTEDLVLAHAAFVRRVARAIVRDDHLADDVTQETLVRAVQSPPQNRGALRAWLARVARNLALNRVRRESRVERRERAAARPERTESAASQVEREQTLRHVVDAVLALDEPYRSAVMMRYFEGLSTPEIAEREGVSPSAVRSRLARAMERLRVRLDDAHGGDRQRWTALLLVTFGDGPLAPPPAAPAPEPATVDHGPGLDWSTGRSWMTVGAKVAGTAAVAVALLVGAVALLWSDPYEVEESDGARGVAKSSLVPGHASREADPDGERRNGTSAVEDSSATAAAARASISGEVRFHPEDSPAAGAVVRLYAEGGGGELIASVETAENGAFRLPADDRRGPFRIAVANPAGPEPTLRGVALFPEESLYVGTLWLSPPLDVRAVVVDEAGRPVAGARVAAHLERTCAEARDMAGTVPPAPIVAESGPDGRAGLDGLTPGTWTLRATHDGYAPGGVAGIDVLGVRPDRPVQIVLERGAPLGGRVTHPDGSPAAAVTVVALPPRDGSDVYDAPVREILRAEAVTDDEGHYAFPALARGTHAIGIASEGASVARLWIVDVPAVETFDIRLSGAGIAGVVTDAESGRPVAGAVVHAAAWRAHHPTHYAATTDDEGRYRIALAIPSMIQGPARNGGGGELGVHLRAEKPGWVLEPEGVDTLAEGIWARDEGDTEWNLRMRRAAALEGVVNGPDGPVAGVDVTANVWNDRLGSVRRTTVSDADGLYRFPGLYDGRAKVTAEKRGYAHVPVSAGGWAAEPDPPSELVVDVPRTGTARLDLTLVRGAKLSGRVVTSGQAAVAGARVTAGIAAGAAATTDAEGHFELHGLPPDTEVRLHVTCEGFGTAEATAAAGGAEPLEIVLGDAAVVGGRVIGPAGDVPDGAYVQVAPADHLENGSYVLVGIWQRVAKHPVAADGRFEIPVPVGADGGAVRVRAAAPGLAPALSDRLQLSPGAHVIGVSLGLDAGHVLAGRVVAADGSGPVAGATVEFVNAELPREMAERRGDMFNPGGRPFEIMAVTGADGTFRIEALPAWSYDVRVIAEGFHWAHATARVPGSEELAVEMARGGVIAGTARYADDAPAHSLVVIAVDDQGRRSGQSRTSPDGAFRIEGLRGEAFTLRVEPVPYGTADVLPADVGTAKIGDESVPLVVERGAGVISGTCTTTGGRPAAGVYVSAKPMDGGTVIRTRTDGDGAYVLRGLTDVPHALVAVCTRPTGGPETIGQRCSLERRNVEVGTTGLRLDLIPTITWTGRAVREDGEPLPHGTVISLREAPDSPWRHIGRLGADGSFSFATVRSVPYEVTLTDPATGQPMEIAGGALHTPSSADATLVVPTGGAIAGEVVGADGRPVPRATVLAHVAGGETFRAVSDNLGRFRITGLSQTAAAEIVAISHEVGRATADGVRAGDTGVRLTLRAGDELALRLLTAADEPVRSRLLTVRDGDTTVLHLRTDAEGRAATRALPSGTYELVCTDSGERVGTVATGTGETVLRLE